ncbi:MAG: O-antigen ligase family protein [Bacteroidia bacterium]|nr:O-antigen ligase family protein [Bacteroidia bacterium]MBP9688715.1 O-antigen ligase family protein [Bacteroidia bacterium]
MKVLNKLKYAHWINYLLFALLAGMPLIYNESGIDPSLLPKQLLISLYVLVALVAVFTQPKVNLPINITFLYLLFALVVVYWLSVFTATNRVEAIYICTKITLYVAVFFTTYILILQQKIAFKFIVLGIAFGGLVTVLLAFRDFYLLKLIGINLFESDNIYKVNATFGHKNLLSSYLLFTLPFVIIKAIGVKQRFLKFAWILLAITVVGLLVVLQTRAALLALIIGLICMAFFGVNWFDRPKSKHKFLMPFMFLLMLLMFVSGLFIFKDKLTVISRTESFRERAALWQNSWQMIQEYPMGVGAGNWQIMLPKYGVQKFYEFNYRVTEGLTTFQRPHNDFIWVFSETGILGGLIFLLIFVYAFVVLKSVITNKQNQTKQLILLIGFLATYATVSLVDFPLERMEHSFLFFVTLAYIASLSKGGKCSNKYVMPIGGIFFSIIVFGVYVSSKRWQSEKHLSKMYNYHQQANWQQLINHSAKANTAFINMDYFSVPISWYAGVGYFSLGDINMAKTKFEEAYLINPYQIHVLNNLGVCYTKQNNYQLGLPLLIQANKISPTFSDGISTLAGAYYNVKRYGDAWATIATFKFDANNPQYIKFATAIVKANLREILLKSDQPLYQQKIQSVINNEVLIQQHLSNSSKDSAVFFKGLINGN